jgi:hypothetical protein
LLGLIVVGGCGPGVTADEPLWDPGGIPTFRLELPGDWEAALEEAFDPFECGDRAYLRGALRFENPATGEVEVWEDVGVRYRGHNVYEESALERRGFKLSFEEFVPDRSFHGVEKINLLGTEGDYTLLRERLALGLARDVGLAAPRVGHARVYVNGRFLGLFPNSEEADDQRFLDAHFDDPDGSYFKVKGYCGDRATLQHTTDDLAALALTYEPKAGTDEAALTDDLLPLLQCASAEGDDALAACLPDHVDVEAWLTEIALDMVLPDVDGMAGAGQNFLLYKPPAGRFVVVPWDKDLSLTLTNHDAADGSIFTLHPFWLEGSQPELVNRMRELHREQFCGIVLDVAARHAALADEVDRLETLLLPHVKDDPFLDWQTWQWILDDLHETIRVRHDQVVEEATPCAG